jgi:SAM-dependent MidA family methyltransferase
MPESTSALAMLLREEICARGPMTFREFMQQSLYHPQHGYYSSGRARIGRGGDFFTNVSVGPLFGTLLARQFEEMWRRLGEPGSFAIVEQGAHSGDFARDVLRALRSNAPWLFAVVQYHIVEPASAGRALQETTLADFASKLTWAATLDELASFCGVHFSNELIDSFPVHALVWDGVEWREQHIDFRHDRFVFVDGPLTTAPLRECTSFLPTPPCPGARAEINVAALEWLDQLAPKLERGYVLAIDYGFARAELSQLMGKSGGTLTASFRHHRELDVLARPGEVDLTAHVDFTSLAERAETRGLALHGFTDQHHFMVGLSQEHFHDTTDLTPERAQEMRAFKTLMHPELMGTSFKAICLEKHLPKGAPLLGFRFAADARTTLGLK